MGALVGSWGLTSGWGRGESGGAPWSAGPLFRLSELEDRGVSLLGFPGCCTPSFLSWVTLDELVYLCSVPNLLVSGKRPRHSLQLPRCPTYPEPDKVPGLGWAGTGHRPSSQWLSAVHPQVGTQAGLGSWKPASVWDPRSLCGLSQARAWALPDPICSGSDEIV